MQRGCRDAKESRFLGKRNTDIKVAGLDKPQRTRILERQVQTDEHEKVQGGYGKYQGKWVGMSR